MGNKLPTPEKTVEQQEIITQVGYNNHVQHTNNILNQVSQLNWYIFVIIILVAAVGVFFVFRYVNKCINKKIDRRAQANLFRLSKMEHVAA